MGSAELFTNSALVLQSILEYITGCSLMAIVVNPDGSQIRLDWQLLATTNLPSLMSTLRLVITGEPKIFYLSYTEAIAYRQPITDFNSIVSKNLLLQGAALFNTDSLILFSNSSNQIEAGELHVSFTGFRLYDEHYGHLPVTTLLAKFQEWKEKK